MQLSGFDINASVEYFFPSAWEEIERRVLATSRVGLKLLKAELGNQAGMVGAAKLVWHSQGIVDCRKFSS